MFLARNYPKCAAIGDVESWEVKIRQDFSNEESTKSTIKHKSNVNGSIKLKLLTLNVHKT